MSRHRSQQRKRARARAARLERALAPLVRAWHMIVSSFGEHHRSGRPMSIDELMSYSGTEAKLSRDIRHARHSA